MFTTTRSQFIQEVYEEQLHIYKTYKPTDKKTLATYPTILEDMATIDGVCPANNDEDRLKALRELEGFNRMWFPDTSVQEQRDVLMQL